MTHAELVAKAAAWLRRNGFPVVFSEISTGVMEIPDAIGFSSSGETAVVECKASRADFLRDAKKYHRRERSGLGNARYYMAPEGVIRVDASPREGVSVDKWDKAFVYSVLRRLDVGGLLDVMDVQQAQRRLIHLRRQVEFLERNYRSGLNGLRVRRMQLDGHRDDFDDVLRTMTPRQVETGE